MRETTLELINPDAFDLLVFKDKGAEPLVMPAADLFKKPPLGREELSLWRAVLDRDSISMIKNTEKVRLVPGKTVKLNDIYLHLFSSNTCLDKKVVVQSFSRQVLSFLSGFWREFATGILCGICAAVLMFSYNTSNEAVASDVAEAEHNFLKKGAIESSISNKEDLKAGTSKETKKMDGDKEYSQASEKKDIFCQEIKKEAEKAHALYVKGRFKEAEALLRDLIEKASKYSFCKISMLREQIAQATYMRCRNEILFSDTGRKVSECVVLLRSFGSPGKRSADNLLTELRSFALPLFNKIYALKPYRPEDAARECEILARYILPSDPMFSVCATER